MPDERLKTFLAVARCGNLTHAAKELFISQPAVTLQIHKLEDEYKEALFYRKERGVELTPAGHILYEYAKRIDHLYDEASEEINALSGKMRGMLRVGATLTIGEYVLPSVMGRFKTAYPLVDILLEVENTQRVVELVTSGLFDCGLVEGPVDNGLIRTENLSADELIIVCSPKHRFADTNNVLLEDILYEQFIMREPGSGTRKVFEDALIQSGRDVEKLKILMQLGSTQAIKALVSQNLGLSVLSQWTVREELKAGTLCRINIPEINLKRLFNFIFKRDSRLSLITRRFVQACRESVL